MDCFRTKVKMRHLVLKVKTDCHRNYDKLVRAKGGDKPIWPKFEMCHPKLKVKMRHPRSKFKIGRSG